jgi:hypothetical protein
VDFLSVCARNTFALVPVVGAQGCRRIVKLSYDEELRTLEEDPDGGFSRLIRQAKGAFPAAAVSMGWRPRTLSLRIADMGGAQSHHVQVCAPPNVEMTAALLTGYRPIDLIYERVYDRRPQNITRAYTAFRGKKFHTRAHLYLESCARSASGTARVSLRAERSGFSTWAVAAAFVVAALLVVYRVRLDNLVEDASASASLLLLVPGIAAAFIARANEHALARRLLVVPRAALVLSAFATFVAATVLLAFSPDPSESVQVPHAYFYGGVLRLQRHGNAPKWEKQTLAVLAGVAAVALLLLMIQRVLPRPARTPPPESKIAYDD